MKWFIKNISYPFFAKRDGVYNLKHHLQELEKHESLSLEEIREYQLKNIQALIKHAYQTSPFYRDRMKKMGIVPSDIKTLNDFSQFPILKKEDIIEHREEMVSNSFAKDEIHLSQSGGTTGNLVTFYRDNGCISQKEAALLHFERWAGWDFGTWKSYIWPATFDFNGASGLKSAIKNFLYQRVIIYPAIKIKEDEALKILYKMKRKGVHFVRAFPGALKEVAHIARKYQIQFDSIKGIVTTGELMLDYDRKFIEETFQAPIFNSYRTREIGLIGQECRAHHGLHINSAHVYVEVVDEEKNLPVKNQLGKILVTDLLNRGMPFIRYEIGDIGIMEDSECSCGRKMPLISQLGGRLSDALYTTKGEKLVSISVIPNMFSHFLKEQNQFQLIQEDYDKITIRLTYPELNKETILEQKNVARQIFGEDIKIKYEYVDEIPRLKSGKYPIIVSKIKRNSEQ